MERNKIYHGNCLDYFDQIEPESIDLVFTDPPYIKALTDLYTDWNGRNMDFEVYGELYNRILKDNGQVAIFADFETAVAITNCFQRYFKFKFYWIWQKPLGQPVNKSQPILNTEMILVFAKKETKTKDLTFNWQSITTKGLPYKKDSNGGNATRKNAPAYITDNQTGARYPKQVLNYPAKCNMTADERQQHPTQKPEGLCGTVIKALSNKNDVILDTFAGSGSIPAAAYKLDRQFIGIEKEKKYYEMAKKRIDMENLSLFRDKSRILEKVS